MRRPTSSSVRPRRGERAVLLDHVRARRGRRRAAVGGDAEHAADHRQLRAAGRTGRDDGPRQRRSSSPTRSAARMTCRGSRTRRSMVAGEVKAPYVPLGNERIDRRHAHSVALAAFFRDQKELTGETWSTAGSFFLGGNPPERRVWPYLRPVPDGDQRSRCGAMLPDDVPAQIGVETGAWAEELCDAARGRPGGACRRCRCLRGAAGPGIQGR